MSTIKNCGLDKYGDEPLEQRQFGTAGVEGVNHEVRARTCYVQSILLSQRDGYSYFVTLHILTSLYFTTSALCII